MLMLTWCEIRSNTRTAAEKVYMLGTKCAADLNVFLRLSVNTSDKDEAKAPFLMTGLLNTSVFKAGNRLLYVFLMRVNRWSGLFWGGGEKTRKEEESRKTRDAIHFLKPRSVSGWYSSSLHAQSEQTIYLFTKIIWVGSSRVRKSHFLAASQHTEEAVLPVPQGRGGSTQKTTSTPLRLDSEQSRGMEESGRK